MIRSAADPKRLSPSLIWSPYQRRMPFSGAPCMLNFFFPFLNTAAQPNREPEGKTRRHAETATPEHSHRLTSPDPVPPPQAPRRKSAGSNAKRATKPAGKAGAKKVVAGRHQQPEKARFRGPGLLRFRSGWKWLRRPTSPCSLRPVNRHRRKLSAAPGPDGG